MPKTMYQAESSAMLFKIRRADGRPRLRAVSRTVVILGLTSLVTDISTEMVTTALPLYVVFALGATPFVFGIIDAIQQGASALVRVGAGFWADRSGRYKRVAVAGYGLGAVSKLGLLLAGGATGFLSAAVLVDRIGKGIRTGPRDAMISLSSSRESLGVAFGVHRAMDTAGALLGPLVTFGLLALAPGAFDAVFMVSLCFAVVGVAILVLFADEPEAAPEVALASAAARSLDQTQAISEVETETVTLRKTLALVQIPGFRRLLIAGTLLAAVTMSDAFVYLTLQRRLDFDPVLVPLLFFGSAFAYMALAIPAGRIADRVGRVRMFLAGHVLLVTLYAILLLAPDIGASAIIVGLLLLGAYYATTDGVLMAQASSILPTNQRASGLSVLVTGTSLARLMASLAFGALWTAYGLPSALTAFGIALCLAVAGCAVLFLATRRASAAGV